MRVQNLAGDIRVTNRIGEISLTLPRNGQYNIDARSKLGEVTSEFDGKSSRPLLLAEKFVSRVGKDARQLYLRVGIGEINIRKSAP